MLVHNWRRNIIIVEHRSDNGIALFAFLLYNIDMERYILARLLFGGFILFLVIFLIIRIATGGEETPVVPDFVTGNTSIDLGDLSSSSSSSVVFTKKGRINAKEDHMEIRFTISKSRRVVEVINGYDGKVESTLSLPNTEAAYEQFLYSIREEGFTNGKPTPTSTDPRGICSSGTQYFYKVRSGAATISDLWSTSCKSSQGTFNGGRSDIVNLFERQFPDFEKFEKESGAYRKFH